MPTSTLTHVTVTARRIPDAQIVYAGDVTSDVLLVAVDEVPHRLRVDPYTDARDSADDLLRRHAGYQRVGDWRQTGPGTYTAALAEIPNRCLICVHGCNCEFDTPGCPHYGCFGQVPDERRNTCPGAAVVADQRWANLATPAVAKTPARKPVCPYVRRYRRITAGDVRVGMTVSWNHAVRFVVRAVYHGRYGSTYMVGSFTNLVTGVVDHKRTELGPQPSGAPLLQVLA